MPEKIPPHTHCKICGKAIPEGKIYCSKACQDADLAAQRKARRSMILYFIFLFGIMIILLLLPLLRGHS